MEALRRQGVPILAGVTTFALSAFFGGTTLFFALLAINDHRLLAAFLAAIGFPLILLGATTLAWGAAWYLRRRQPARPPHGTTPWPDPPSPAERQWPY